MAKPSDKAEAVARELSAEIGTNISADDPIVALSLYLHNDVEKTLASIEDANNEGNANQKKLVDTLIKQIENKKTTKSGSLLFNNYLTSMVLILILLTNFLLLLLILW